MRNYRKHFAFLMSFLLMASAVSCGSGGSETQIPQETLPADTTPAETETELRAELPDKTYNGEEVMFLTSLNKGYDWAILWAFSILVSAIRMSSSSSIC